MAKFNIKDQVFFLPLQTPAIVLDIKVSGLILVEPIYEIQILNSGSVELATESELEYSLPTFKPPEELPSNCNKSYNIKQDGSISQKLYNNCECGAWATSNNTAHSIWCRQYRNF